MDLIDISSYIPAVPWIAFGDFNEISDMRDRSDFYQCMHLSRGVQAFRDCLNEADLFDLKSECPLYIWCNKRSIGFVAKKLDRMLVNDKWLPSFPNFIVEFPSPPHTFLITELGGSGIQIQLKGCQALLKF